MKQGPSLCGVIFPLVICCLLSLPTIAATVSTCDEAGLRAALSGGTVTFACDGTITLTSTITITNDTVLDGTGHNVIISGGGAVRVFNISTGVTFTVIGLTIADGKSTNGGGFLNIGTLTLANCILSNNVALASAGAAGTNGTNGATTCCGSPGGPGSPGLDGDVASGGGIYNAGVMEMTNSTFFGNSAHGGDGGAGGKGGNGGFADPYDIGYGGNAGNGGVGGQALGGGICNVGEATLIACSFIRNGTIGGAGGAGGRGGGGSVGGNGGIGGGGGMASGAAVHNEGALIVRSTTLADNGTQGGTGGMGGTAPWVGQAGKGGDGGKARGAGMCNSANGSTFITNTTFAANAAVGGTSGGGGLYDVFCPAFAGNGGDAEGGAVANSDTVWMVNCTMWNNSVIAGLGAHNTEAPMCPGEIRFGTNGQAIGSSLLNTNGNLNLLDTIVGGSVGVSQSPNNCFGIITDGGHNICSDDSAGFSASGSLNNTDPKLGPLANNGGPTETMALLPNSPAIDAGDDQLCPLTDQRGVFRPQGAHCDIGAFEQTFLSVSALQNGSFRLEYHGVPNERYALKHSVDFVSWGNSQTNTATSNGIVTFEVVKNLPECFFKIALP
jgi:hypothetical protein